MPATRPEAWSSVLRSALLYSPFLALALALFIYLAAEVAREGISGGSTAGLVIAGSVSLLLGYQALQALRDLFSQLVETTGTVERRWSRNEFLLFSNVYIFVGRNVFRLDPAQAIDVQLGDTVSILHYPHTGAVERVQVLERAGQSAGGARV